MYAATWLRLLRQNKLHRLKPIWLRAAYFRSLGLNYKCLQCYELLRLKVAQDAREQKFRICRCPQRCLGNVGKLRTSARPCELHSHFSCQDRSQEMRSVSGPGALSGPDVVWGSIEREHVGLDGVGRTAGTQLQAWPQLRAGGGRRLLGGTWVAHTAQS